MAYPKVGQIGYFSHLINEDKKIIPSDIYEVRGVKCDEDGTIVTVVVNNVALRWQAEFTGWTKFTPFSELEKLIYDV